MRFPRLNKWNFDCNGESFETCVGARKTNTEPGKKTGLTSNQPKNKIVCTIKEIIITATSKQANEHRKTHGEQDFNRSIQTEETEAGEVGGNLLTWQEKSL